MPANQWLSLNYLRRATNHMEPDAFNDLGVLFESDEGKRPLPVASLVLLLTGAQGGSAIACTNVGGRIDNGYGPGSNAVDELRLPRDVDLAVEWYKLGAARGDVAAQLRIAGALIPDPAAWAGSPAALQHPDRAAEAFAWADLAADDEVPGAVARRDALRPLLTPDELAAARGGKTLLMIHLTDREHDAEGFGELAFKTFRDLGEARKSAVGLYLLGLCYDHGWGTAEDPAKAYACCETAGEKGVSLALVFVANARLAGSGVAKDPAVAVAAYRRAAELGDALALHGLYECYRDGVGVPKDEALARRFCEASGFRGYGLALREHALSLRPDEREERLPRCRDLLLAADALGDACAAAEVKALEARHAGAFRGKPVDGWQDVVRSIYGTSPEPPERSIYAGLSSTDLSTRIA